MGDHTRPLTAFDWTMHVPLIFHQPGTVEAGRRIDRMVSNYDLLPSILSLAIPGFRLENQTVDNTVLNRPGRDLSITLQGEAPAEWDQVHYFEFENVRAVRTPQWKYIERIHQTPNELYDLTQDPQEHENLYGLAEHESTVLSLRQRLHAFFDRHSDPKWDLWHGGRSKTDIFTEKLFGIRNPYTPSRYETSPPAP
jgi:arylsulfatase A-like enzyme